MLAFLYCLNFENQIRKLVVISELNFNSKHHEKCKFVDSIGNHFQFILARSCTKMRSLCIAEKLDCCWTSICKCQYYKLLCWYLLCQHSTARILQTAEQAFVSNLCWHHKLLCWCFLVQTCQGLQSLSKRTFCDVLFNGASRISQRALAQRRVLHHIILAFFFHKNCMKFNEIGAEGASKVYYVDSPVINPIVAPLMLALPEVDPVFPVGGGAKPMVGCTNIRFWQNLEKTAWNWEFFGT